jgi:hypothetical protein
MTLGPKLLIPFAARAVIVTVAVLLAMGAQAGPVIARVLDIALAMPQRPVHEEKEEHPNHGKAGAVDRRNRDRLPGMDRPALADRERLPIPTLAARSPFPPGVLPDHESDLRYGLGAPLRC